MRIARKGSASRRVAAQRAQVSNAVGVLVREFLDKGVPFDKAVKNAALGTHRIHGILVEAGVKISRRTVHTRLPELYEMPIGRMPAHLHDAAPDVPVKVWWLGANTYNLYLDPSPRGKRLLAALRRYDLARSRWRGHSSHRFSLRSSGTYYSPSGVGLRANLVEQVVGGLLEWAILHAEGQRNNIGNWLAWRCRAKGLDTHEVEDVMDHYQEAVCWLASHPYTHREAMSTVRSVFRRGAVFNGG